MIRYRYRTDILVGSWRDSPEAAAADAVRARQAEWAPGDPARIHWLVPGWIEAELPEGAAD